MRPGLAAPLYTLALALAAFLSPAQAAPEPSHSDRSPAIETGPTVAGPSTSSATAASEPVGDLWDRIRAGFAMPDLVSPQVADRQAWYAARPQQIKLMVERSRRYLYHIVEELERRGLPTELALLPMVESAFNPMAYSSAKASGLWQFIPSTGRHFRLDQTWWLDERRDIVASTSAALDYLTTIHAMHGDWHLALASYNWGENAVTRAVERNRKLGLPTDYNSLQMPNETRWYVPKLQALKNIILDPEAAGIRLDPIADTPYFATVQLNRDIDLELAAQLAEMPLADLIALNPAHNRPMVASDSETPLVIPAEKLERFLDNVANTEKPLTVWQKYMGRRGEKLTDLAARFNTTVQTLRAANGIAGTGQLRADAEMLVPANGQAQVPDGLFKAAATISAEPEVVRVTIVARKGDNWATLASRLGVRSVDMQRWNSGATVSPGRVYVAWHAGTDAASLPAQRGASTSGGTTGAGGGLVRTGLPTTPGAASQSAAPGQRPMQTRQIQRTGAARTVQATVTRPVAPPPTPKASQAPAAARAPTPAPASTQPAPPGRKTTAQSATRASQG
jgi:membrane-bound lytic murein transglycosylase D